MTAKKTYSNGRIKGAAALSQAEHEWLLQTVPNGLATKYEAAVRLRVSIPTINAWLKRPLGYQPPKSTGRPKGIAPASHEGAGLDDAPVETGRAAESDGTPRAGAA